MNKLELIKNGVDYIIHPLDTLSSTNEVLGELAHIGLTLCSELSNNGGKLILLEEFKNVYYILSSFDTMLMNGLDVNISYNNTLYNIIDTTNQNHVDFIKEYNGVDDLDKALFYSRAGRVLINYCPVSNEYVTNNIEAFLLNGQAIIGGYAFLITEDWVYEYL